MQHCLVTVDFGVVLHHVPLGSLKNVTLLELTNGAICKEQ